MKVEEVKDNIGLKKFSEFPHQVYKNNKYYRGTEASIESLLIKGPTVFHNNATVKPFIIYNENMIVGRFSLIKDRRLPEYVQVSFFDAYEGLTGILEPIRETIKKNFPAVKKFVVGLNGHLNYGAGFLLNRFDESPVFGLPYSPPWYSDYFKELDEKKMVSYRFKLDKLLLWAEKYKGLDKMEGLSIRFMNKKNIKNESRIYTELNNKAFTHHPFWADRDPEEDIELFYPFRFLLKNENLIFAEFNGKPVGFLLWYPDLNELKKDSSDLNVLDVIKYKFGRKFKTFRFTEIGILPEFQKTPIGLALFRKIIPVLQKEGYQYCEGGFIFEENRASINLGIRTITRSLGEKPEPYRQYAVYEGVL